MRNLSFLLVFFFTACSSPENVQNPVVSAGATSVDPLSAQRNRLVNAHDVFLFNASQAQVLVTKKYSRITVPAGSFERKDGSAPANVKVVFSEYQTAGEIIASELPMTYVDDKKDTILFESAGMFEIRAFEGENELKIKPGKQISIELSTPAAGKFNFYALNDNTRSWSEKAKDLSPVPNRFLQAQEEQLKELEALTVEKPKKQVALKEADKLFDIKVDTKDYPEFAEMPGVLWKYAGAKGKKDPIADPAVFLKAYDFMQLRPKEGSELIYEVDFRSKKDTVSIDLAPVFKGKAAERNQERTAAKLEKFNALLKEQEALRQQNRNESKLLRQFNISELGVYNYDRQLKDEQAIPILAEFTFDGKAHADFPLAAVYLIPKGKLAAVIYTQETAALFAINPYERNQLVAITGENDVYVLSDAEIRKLKPGAFRNKRKVFDLKKAAKPAKTGNDIDQILAGL